MRLTALLVCFTAGVAFAQPSIIPAPLEMKVTEGRFSLDTKTRIFNNSGIAAVSDIAQMLDIRLGQLAIFDTSGTVYTGNSIVFRDLPTGGEEAYELSVTPTRVTISAHTANGAFYAMQTLLQLMPPIVFQSDRIPSSVRITAVEIKDEPRYSYRGMHLDVCRHFFPVAFVKKYIDLLAMHKMNRFHWHLTEDQGWRIEIKKYPKLTEIGGWRKETMVGHYTDQPRKFDGKKYGGFYTQDEVREIVKYASERFVTIIPEIEMPGHSLAALSAYPELACTDGPFEAATIWGVFDDVYCPEEGTFKFLEDVLSEVCDLFPGTYIHIGGDECPKERWKTSPLAQKIIKDEKLGDEHGLQSWFVRRIEKFLNSKGKRMIGWDEILEGGIAPDATIMSWQGIKGGIAAAKQNHDAIMTPGNFCYFDHYQSKDTKNEPVAIGGYTPVEEVYSYEPTPEELTPEQAKHILGAQGNVWTEYILESHNVEYMAFPRACALSEVLWSTKSNRNWEDFVRRFQMHSLRLDGLHVNYARHILK